MNISLKLMTTMAVSPFQRCASHASAMVFSAKKMNYLNFLLVLGALFMQPFEAQAQEMPAEKKNISLFIAITPGKCELLEVGIQGNADASIDQTKLQITGKGTESDPQVYRCEVEIPDTNNFNSTYSYCALTGFNAASTYFFRGEPKTLSRSCSTYRLKNGNFYFSATGISADLCSWSCIAK